MGRTRAARMVIAGLCLAASATAVAAQGVGMSTRRSPSAAAADSEWTADHLFDGALLHDVWMHMNARDWAELRSSSDENTYYPCDFEWRGVKAYNAGCRSRGAYTRNGLKPGIRVEFDHYVAGQTFLGLTSVVLRNLWQDPSMLKERITMQVFHRMGVPAPRGAHARLFVGAARSYGGVYVLTEDVNEQFLIRHWGRADGYLYEYRWVDAYGFGDLGADLDAYRARFEPRTHRLASAFELYAPVRNLIAAINDAPAEALEETVGPHFDVRRFLTHAAVENVVSAWDGLLGTWSLNNFYLYRYPGTTRSVLIPWDEDNTFIWLEMPPWHNVEGNVLMRKAWASPPLRTYYLNEIARAAALLDWIDEEIDREASQIRAAVAADPFKNSTNAEFEEAVEALKLFARRRGDVVRGYFSALQWQTSVP